MDKSKLSDHIFKKGKFTTPWNYALGKISQSQSWSLNRLPEYLWLALILNKYGRKNGLEKLYFILTELHSISSDVKYPTFSNILNLSEKAQLEFFRYLVKIAGENILNPLTLIYTYSEYRAFSKVFTNPSISPEERQHTIVETMEKGFMHQSEFATDIRFLVVFFSI
ncbi:MAG: hypothetical protein MJA82_14250, partial [Clostridia bacterium]|nr:hypothetical protein [Clostridia bacterium]